jgi:hypothetical protein
MVSKENIKEVIRYFQDFSAKNNAFRQECISR